MWKLSQENYNINQDQIFLCHKDFAKRYVRIQLFNILNSCTF